MPADYIMTPPHTSPPTTTWYCASRYTWMDSPSGITTVHVERETEKCIWVGGNRRDKIQQGEQYFPNREDAVKWRSAYLQRQIENAETVLAHAKEAMRKFLHLEQLP
jgi:hypothetical protein